MSRRKLQKTGECVYCGKVAQITEDHIPPKNIFAKPRPNNLIKVPCCKECHSENNQVSQDDEYFRLMLTLREDTYNHPDIEKILPIVLRSLARPDKVGFAKSLIKGMKKVIVRTQSGLYLGTKPSYDVNLERLDNVAKRIARGLFYNETGNRLPNEYEVVVYSMSGLRNVTGKVKQYLIENIIKPLMTTSPKIIGEQVFLYWVSHSNTDVNISVWLFLFYKRVAFLCMTKPIKCMERMETKLSNL